MTVLRDDLSLRIEIDEYKQVTITDKQSGTVVEIAPATQGLRISLEVGHLSQPNPMQELYFISRGGV